MSRRFWIAFATVSSSALVMAFLAPWWISLPLLILAGLMLGQIDRTLREKHELENFRSDVSAENEPS